MINIDDAIMQSKSMKNTSDGGSPCFDFGDVVLVRYGIPIQFLKNGERAREKSEEIMEAINEKAKDGVNTPTHLEVKRVIDGDIDFCYVLQKKCPGVNCTKLSKYDVSFDEMCDTLKFVLNIPFEHYQKLIIDGCKLFEMGYEAKNKNLFYDVKTGFWFIDFLFNDKNCVFDPNDVEKMFTALRYRIPKPIQIASLMKFGTELSEEEKEKKQKLKYAINAKTLLAIKSVLPNFERYEKFFLFDEEDEYKKYLMEEGIVNKDLTVLDSSDYDIYHSLYEHVINGLMDKIVNKGEPFWSIECNDIRIDSSLFYLTSFFSKSIYCNVKREEFDDEHDYKYEVEKSYTTNVLNTLVNRLSKIEPNENVTAFLEEASKKLQPNGPTR